MATSTCIKCGSSSFEAVEPRSLKSNYRQVFIQCASCGGVVGTTEYFNTTYLLHKIMSHLGIPKT